MRLVLVETTGGSVFQIIRGKSILERRIVDKERNAEFRTVSGFAYSNRVAALLTWGDRQIPLEHESVSKTDATTGRVYGLHFFDQFGASQKVSKVAGVGPYVFSSPEERAEALLIAIEAVLVQAYSAVNGEWDVDGVRVSSEGREWKASDFGHHSSATADGSTR